LVAVRRHHARTVRAAPLAAEHKRKAGVPGND
jgi:hypothetical protein